MQNEPAEIIRRFMKENHLTQQALADLLGVAQPTVFGWLVGNHGISPKIAIRLERMGGPRAYLFHPFLQSKRFENDRNND